MKSPRLCFMLLSLLVMTALPVSSRGASYWGYETWGGTWHDANKTSDNTEDDSMCWAASAANLLAWTGWGFPPGQAFVGADDIFLYFQEHWTNEGGNALFGLNWWFEGNDPYEGWEGDWTGWSQVEVPGGGFWATAYSFEDYYAFTGDDAVAMVALDYLLNNGYGVSISIGGPGGHALTVWGFDYESATGAYLGIHVTDSDDMAGSAAPVDPVLSYYGVRYDPSVEKWYLQEFYGSDNWYIAEVQGLKIFPTPLPAALWLLGSGLILLGGLSKLNYFN